METPVLSAKQQRKSLTDKKSQLKSIRNFLAPPTESNWSSIGNADEELLLNQLKLYFLKINQAQCIFPRQKKNNLKEKTESNEKTQEIPADTKGKQKKIKLGLNEVNRCIQTCRPTCILLSGSATLTDIIHHICTLASLKNIPFLLVNNLENHVCDYLGFKTIAIAFMHNIDDKCFNDLWNIIESIFKKNHTRNIQIQSKKHHNRVHKETSNNEKQDERKSTGVIYLNRTSSKSRVFIPSQYENVTSTSTSKLDDFIELYNENTSKMENKKQTKINSFPSDNNTKKARYVSLKVKRIQGKKKH